MSPSGVLKHVCYNRCVCFANIGYHTSNLLPSHMHTHTHRYLVSIGCIKPLCDLLTVQDTRIVLITLEGLENILKVGQLDLVKNGGMNPFAVLIEEAYGECSVSPLTSSTFILAAIGRVRGLGEGRGREGWKTAKIHDRKFLIVPFSELN